MAVVVAVAMETQWLWHANMVFEQQRGLSQFSGRARWCYRAVVFALGSLILHFCEQLLVVVYKVSGIQIGHVLMNVMQCEYCQIRRNLNMY